MQKQEFLTMFPAWQRFFQAFSEELSWEVSHAPNARCLGLMCEDPKEWETFRLGIDNSLQQSPKLELARGEVFFSFNSPLFEPFEGFEVSREIVGHISEDELEILQEVLGSSLRERVNLYDLQARDVLLLHIPLEFGHSSGLSWSKLEQTFGRWRKFLVDEQITYSQISSWRALWNPSHLRLSLEINLSDMT